MDERAALDVVATRAVETGDADRTLWTDADRAWATRAAGEIVGEGAAAERFLARRAHLVLERLAERRSRIPRAVAGLRWRPWVGAGLIAAAFIFGAIVDGIGSAARIDLLAPPVFGLVAWNLAVYVLLGIATLRTRGPRTGALRRALTRAAGRVSGGEAVRANAVSGVEAAIVAMLARQWAALAAPLYAARAARILHVAAAALAAGVVAGLYVRGLAFEYRATWESTFLGPAAVHALVATVLAPGALVTGLAVPDVAHIAALRAPASENAALWLHLLAATVAVVVIVPRLLLAAVAGIVERRRAARFAVTLDAPYFRRLLRGYRGGSARVDVVPYSYTLAPAAQEGLRAVVGRAFDGDAVLTLAPAVAYGDEDRARGRSDDAAALLPLFNLAATPEPEAHGRFAAVLAPHDDGGAAAVALVDESAWRARWGAADARLEERRAAWRAVLAPCGIAPLFVDLAAPDLAAIERAFDATFAAHDAFGRKNVGSA